MTDDTTPAVSIAPLPLADGGDTYRGAKFYVPLKSCCRVVFAGEECGCPTEAELDALPAIVWDRRTSRTAA